MIKILIGGSPCTYWSIAQTKHREKKAEGMGWELFKNYLIAKEKFKPDFFLYENNVSAAEEIKQMIRECLDVDDGTLFSEGKPNRYIEINSALVSAQNRQRFYVHNCGDVGQPEDRHIMLRDILETRGESYRDKSECLISRYSGAEIKNNLERKQRTMIAERVPDYGKKDKARPVIAHYYNKSDSETGLQENSFSDNPNKQKFDYVAEAIDYQPRKNSHIVVGENNMRCSQDKNGASCAESFVKINLKEKSETLISARPEMIFDSILLNTVDSKSGTIRASCYKDGIRNLVANNIDKRTCVAMPTTKERKDHPIYHVKDGHITIKGKQYPIKLKDGNYIIRKLTVTECCRLQTMPDHYCDMVSKSQAYKALGNGWTAEVIIHILKHALDKMAR